MALKVIGSGLGRTGTLSMKRALEQLGFGPCHHMIEVFAHPETMALWIAAGEGKGDWDAIYKGYAATVDYPGGHYWRELAAHFPDAKVLHTTRDPESWFESTQATIFTPDRDLNAMPPEGVRFFKSFLPEIFDRIHDREFMIAHFKKHDAEVQAAIPKERLHVHRVGEGWDKLCAFLGVPVPASPFPSENSREEFRAQHRGPPK